jgi:hypothetical protein
VYTTNGAAYPDRNQFYGPHFWNSDFQLAKSFKIRERFGLEVRAEMYNVFNHKNNYIEYTNLNALQLQKNATPWISTEAGGKYGTAGQPTDERRNIQLGAKITF